MWPQPYGHNPGMLVALDCHCMHTLAEKYLQKIVVFENSNNRLDTSHRHALFLRLKFLSTTAHFITMNSQLLHTASPRPASQRSLSSISLTAFLLGQLTCLCLCLSVLLAYLNVTLWRLPAFLGALCMFHFLEFWITARYNPSAATVNSFLLTANGAMWAVVHLASMSECLLTRMLLPQRYTDSVALLFWNEKARILIGFLLTFLSQGIRSLAMAQAGTNFNHCIQYEFQQGHSLVTHGLYQISRHPSYFGFFWWSIGLQLILGNVVCLVAYTAILWCLLYYRIQRWYPIYIFLWLLPRYDEIQTLTKI